MYHLKGLGLVPAVCLVLASCGGSGSESPVSNLAPVVTGDQAVEVFEGVQLTNAYSASDPESGAVTLSLSGTDATVMTLSAAGNLTFNTVPDHEAPADSDIDNIYNVTIVASDSVNETAYTVTVTVNNATEGRVVDGPVSGASVFIDANGDGIQNDDETVVLTNAQGNYSLPAPLSFPASIISIGGTDTQTGKTLPDLALVSEVSSAAATVAITPLTTVIVGIESETDKIAFLSSLGLTGSPEALLAADGWAAAQGGDADALAAQRVNQQIAGVMQAISSVTASSKTAGTSPLDVSRAVASKLVVASADASFSLSSTASLQSIVTESVSTLVTDGAASSAVIAAVANSIANVNEIISDVTIDPTSASAGDILTAMQETVQDSVVLLVAGTITAETFTSNSSTASLFTALPPRITLEGSVAIALELGTAYSDAGATAFDVVDGTVTVTTTGTVDSSAVGTYTITYTASDSSGNAATAVTRTITVADTIAPVISLVGAATISLEQDAAYSDAGATAADAADGTVTVTTTGALDSSTVGTYTITYTASDSSGNAAAAVTRTITVADTIAPVISLVGAATISLEQDAAYNDAGATAADAADGTVTVTTTGTVNTSAAGEYTITYTASDSSGNTATAVTRTITVTAASGSEPDTGTDADVIAPVITLIGGASVSVAQNATYSNLGATATDSVDGVITVTNEGTVDTSTLGTYTLTYSATDSAGNTSTATRTVSVIAGASIQGLALPKSIKVIETE